MCCPQGSDPRHGGDCVESSKEVRLREDEKVGEGGGQEVGKSMIGVYVLKC